jgi:hypothetical protein
MRGKSKSSVRRIPASRAEEAVGIYVLWRMQVDKSLPEAGCCWGGRNTVHVEDVYVNHYAFEVRPDQSGGVEMWSTLDHRDPKEKTDICIPDVKGRVMRKKRVLKR